MSIKIHRYEKTKTQNISGGNNILEKRKSHILNINDTQYGDICTFYLNYVSLCNNEDAPGKEYIKHPMAEISTEKIMYSSEYFEVVDVTQYNDMDDKDILIKSNINIYKRPYKGWNFRLYNTIIFNIMVNGGVTICM